MKVICIHVYEHKFCDFGYLFIHFMVEICQDYVFLKRFIQKKFLFIERSGHSFIPKIEESLKIYWSMNHHLYYQFPQKKTWGHAYFSRNDKNVSGNEKKTSNAITNKCNIKPLQIYFKHI